MKNIDKRKASKNTIALPTLHPKKIFEKLPVDGSIINQSITFSFIFLDREHEYFHLGGNAENKTVGGKWFLDFLDCLKSVGGKTIQELKNRPYCLHPVKWKDANSACPFSPEIEWWQFRINKSRGRVIGMLIDKIFYVV